MITFVRSFILFHFFCGFCWFYLFISHVISSLVILKCFYLLNLLKMTGVTSIWATNRKNSNATMSCWEIYVISVFFFWSLFVMALFLYTSWIIAVFQCNWITKIEREHCWIMAISNLRVEYPQTVSNWYLNYIWSRMCLWRIWITIQNYENKE